ncbi:MAG: Low-specificity L-threonine aldolase, partial [uncultured Thermomicrobiales bacterium]
GPGSSHVDHRRPALRHRDPPNTIDAEGDGRRGGRRRPVRGGPDRQPARGAGRRAAWQGGGRLRRQRHHGQPGQPARPLRTRRRGDRRGRVAHLPLRGRRGVRPRRHPAPPPGDRARRAPRPRGRHAGHPRRGPALPTHRRGLRREHPQPPWGPGAPPGLPAGPGDDRPRRGRAGPPRRRPGLQRRRGARDPPGRPRRRCRLGPGLPVEGTGRAGRLVRGRLGGVRGEGSTPAQAGRRGDAPGRGDRRGGSGRPRRDGRSVAGGPRPGPTSGRGAGGDPGGLDRPRDGSDQHRHLPPARRPGPAPGDRGHGRARRPDLRLRDRRPADGDPLSGGRRRGGPCARGGHGGDGPRCGRRRL